MQQLDEINGAGRGHAAHKCDTLYVSVMVITGQRAHSLCSPLQNKEGGGYVFQPEQRPTEQKQLASRQPETKTGYKTLNKKVYTGL